MSKGLPKYLVGYQKTSINENRTQNDAVPPGAGGTLPDFGWGRAIEAPKTYPFLIPIFRKCIPDLIPNFRKSIPDFIPNFSKMAYLFVLYTKITKIDTIPYTKIVKIDTVPYTKIVKIDTLPDGTSPVPKIYIVSPRAAYQPMTQVSYKTRVYSVSYSFS